MTDTYTIHTRLDEQGRFLGLKLLPYDLGGDRLLKGYSVLQCNAEAFGDALFENLEMLCVAQEYAADQGLELEMTTIDGAVRR